MKSTAILTLMIACTLQGCKPSGAVIGTHKFDTVSFVQTNPPPASAKPVPHVWLDTNMEVDGLLGGGTVKSKRPYHIRLDYTDNSASFASLEVTKVEVTYDDGTIEAATKRLALPHRIAVRPYETVNSMGGGRIVKTTVAILSSELRDAVTRDESLTLKMEGHFTTKTGAKHPFVIDYHYTVKFDKGARLLEDR